MVEVHENTVPYPLSDRLVYSLCVVALGALECESLPACLNGFRQIGYGAKAEESFPS